MCRGVSREYGFFENGAGVCRQFPGMLDDSPGAVYDDRRIDMLFFKKINAGLSLKLIFSGLAALTLFSTFSSCHIYNLSLEDFLKEWTETARVAESKISPEPVYKDSYAHIASGEDTLITYKLVNPQNYDLDETLFWEDGISPVSGTDYYLEWDANDKNIFYLTLKKDFLERLDGTGAKISPSLTLTEPKSKRTFGTYSVPALVNSAPPEVILPVVLRTGGASGKETYVICFNLPEMTGIHQDVKTLEISSPYKKTYTITPDGNLSGDGTELTTTYDEDWQPVTENDAEFVGDTENRFVGIVTDVLLSDNLTTFTLTLTDSSGLSTSVKVSTQAPKLDSVTASPKGGTIKTDGTVTFTSPVAGAGIVLTSNKWAGVKNGEEQVSGDQVTGTDSITLTFTKPGTYNITAYAQMSGAADSDEVTFTYNVVDDSTVYVSDTGNNSNPGTEDKPVATLQRALDLLNDANFTEGKIVVTGTVQTGEVKINAPGDSTTGSVTTLTVRGGSGSAGGTLENKNGRVFTIASGGSLTLGENITLTGTVADGNGGAVYVNGGTFTMEDGSKIIGSSASYGGGVYVDSNGTFTMDGGTISKNSANSLDDSGAGASGGGVYIHNGTFTMSGGTIGGTAQNTAKYGGGVYIAGGTFIMEAGSKITGSNAQHGGGVYIAGGTFTMNGGTIGGTAGNTAEFGGGVYIAGGSFTMNGTAILQGNMATTHGGGVHIFSGGTFTMNGGTISGSIGVTIGGGVFVSGGTFDMIDGTISGNTVTQSGGGVQVNGGNFTMKGGTIGGSEAESPNIAPFGGGVCVNEGTFTMTGGTIRGNTADQKGGGVYVSSTGNFTLDSSSAGSSPVISGNTKKSISPNNVYLYNGKTLSITGKLEKSGGSGNIGISMATPEVFTSNWSSSGSTDSTFFFSDDGSYKIELDSGECKLVNNDSEVKYEVSGSTSSGTFADALAAVNTLAGGTITLLKDIDSSNAVFGDNSANNHPITFAGGTEASPIVLNLNGFIINRGLAVAQANGSVIKIEDGALTIKDSSAAPDGTNGTGTITGGNSVESGGGIRMENDSFLTLESGNIIGNFVTGAYGGGVYVTTGCTFTMEGGNIASNQTDQSDGQGGGVGASNGIFIINGGIITGNTAGKGGGVSIGNYGGFTMTGGTISGNTTYQNGGGVYVSSTGNFTLGSLSAESSPVISGNIKTGNSTNNVYLDNTSHKTLFITGKLIKTKEPGNIGISMATAEVFTDGWSNSDLLESTFFFSDDGSYKIELDSGECKLVNNNSEVKYEVLESTSSGTFAEAVDAVNESGGTIILLKDIDGNNAVFGADSANSHPITFTGGTEASPIILDLNGFTINRGLDAAQANGSVIKMSGGVLTIRDSSVSSTGTITGGNSNTNGGGIFIENNGSLTLENGSITGNKALGDGGGVYFSSNGTFTMSGGIIQSNVASNGSNNGNGGGVCLNGGTFTMSGTATIKNNSVNGNGSKGGGIYLEEGTLTMTGDAAITGNQASCEDACGGGIYLNSGTFNMIDGEITGNNAGHGGGVYFPYKADGVLIFNLGDRENPNTGTDPVIRSNTNYSGKQNNVYVESGAFIKIVGDLLKNVEIETENNIGITRENDTGKFAQNNGHSVSANDIFSSDQTGYIVDSYRDEFNISPR